VEVGLTAQKRRLAAAVQGGCAALRSGCGAGGIGGAGRRGGCGL